MHENIDVAQNDENSTLHKVVWFEYLLNESLLDSHLQRGKGTSYIAQLFLQDIE